jgi:hypothetical protein
MNISQWDEVAVVLLIVWMQALFNETLVGFTSTWKGGLATVD